MVIVGEVIRVENDRAIIRRRNTDVLVRLNNLNSLQYGHVVALVGSWYIQHYLAANLTVCTIAAFNVTRIIKQ